MKAGFSLLGTFILLVNFNLHSQVIDDLFVITNQAGKYQDKVSNCQTLKIRQQKLTELASRSPATFQLNLPFENGWLKLSLHKTRITADNFSVIEAKSDLERQPIPFSTGIFYQGVVEGKPNSIATISIFDDRVMGVIADEKGNIVLGAIEDKGIASNNYVLYRDKDLRIPNPFSCATIDSLVQQDRVTPPASTNRINAVGELVDIYIECDHQMYLDKGSNTNNVINYTLGFFNSVATIYANENIQVQVSQILVWTGPDPEELALIGDALGMLNSFVNRLGNFNGDYAHLVTTRHNTGYGYIIDNPCSNQPPRRFHSAVSGINNTYSDFPVFSWTVFMFSHELGHNLGSNHTHWCGWPVGALDNCFDPEGPCTGPPPVNGGTIMSYCYRGGNYINLANGFGFFPGNKIRSVVGGAPCLGACRMTIALTKNNANCGLYNGGASVEVFDAVGDVSYTWSNGQTGSSLINVGPGSYHVIVTDASGCSVMQVVTISNDGPVMIVDFNPKKTTGFCAGNGVSLSATSNSNYSYQWFKNGVLIPGANSHTFMATSSGNYSVNVSKDFCLVTHSVKIIEVPTPQATISPAGPTNFCSGYKNDLNAYAGEGYFYQWYKNGTAIVGATDSVFDVQESGNFSVKVYAVGCESTSPPVSATVNPTPVAVITLSGNSQLCDGKTLTLFAPVNTTYTYEWFKDGNLIPGANSSSYITTLGGSYSVKTRLGSCTKTSAAINVTILPNPVVSVSPVFSSIPKFQTQTLTATGANTYNWAVFPDVVSYQDNSASFKPLNTTTYVIEGTSNNGCKATANATIQIIGCGQVTEISAIAYSPSRVMINWKNPPGTNSDTLRYRKLGSSSWTSIFVSGESYEINNLEPSTQYEFNLIPLCNTTDGVASATQAFETLPITSTPYLRLFPNPSNESSRLEIVLDKPSKVSIDLYDCLGRKLRSLNATENLVQGQVIKQVNTAVIPSGIYLLVVQIDGNRHALKMIVNH